MSSPQERRSANPFMKLLFEEEKALIDELERISTFLLITPGGDVLLRREIQDPMSRLLCYMIGRAVGRAMGLLKDDTLTLGDISIMTNRKADELAEILTSMWSMFLVEGFVSTRFILPRCWGSWSGFSCDFCVHV